MKLFAIGDLHLSFGTNKPMDIFGPEWVRHAEKIESNWKEMVGLDDIVCVVGDISWAMNAHEAVPDLEWLGALPGRKILIKGNHDYWWNKISHIYKWLPEGIYPLQGSSMILDGIGIVGTRGWLIPGNSMFDESKDRKVYNRECIRLDNAFRSLDLNSTMTKVALLHFPPIMQDQQNTGFTNILESYGASVCLFGHLHGEDRSSAFEGVRNNVRYHLVSCDHTNFSPIHIDL